jgi:predicted GIY-YIG superfamily endonuclease
MAKRYQRDVKKALIEQRQTDNTMAKRNQRGTKKALIEERQTDNTMAVVISR